MICRLSKILILLLALAIFFAPGLAGLAQEKATTTELALKQGEQAPEAEQGEQESGVMSAVEKRAELEKELAGLEKEIAQYEKSIFRTESEKKTLQNQIYILKSKIKKLDLQIQQNNAMAKDIGFQIEDTKSSIDKTSEKIASLRERLLNVLQLIYEKDKKTPIEILLSRASLSDFFEEVVALEALNSRNGELLQNIKALKGSLEEQKNSLNQEKEELEKLLKIQILQKRESQYIKKEQEWLLEKTKGEESEYQALLQERQKRAQELRARIFELIGVPEAPTFGEALELARYVEKVTGVRPAFLLAVLTQESRIGKNVGQCYLPKDPEENASRRVMAYGPPRSKRDDVSYFLKICEELGRDPYNTPVSCPMRYGWGGAMGPAQFIPSTWADPYSSPNKVSYKERVEEILGTKPADPWRIKDAFLAAALYLSDYGAKKQTPNSEWRAAMIYFSGSTNTRYRFYGDSVLQIAKQYQQEIDELE